MDKGEEAEEHVMMTNPLHIPTQTDSAGGALFRKILPLTRRKKSLVERYNKEIHHGHHDTAATPLQDHLNQSAVQALDLSNSAQLPFSPSTPARASEATRHPMLHEVRTSSSPSIISLCKRSLPGVRTASGPPVRELKAPNQQPLPSPRNPDGHQDLLYREPDREFNSRASIKLEKLLSKFKQATTRARTRKGSSPIPRSLSGDRLDSRADRVEQPTPREPSAGTGSRAAQLRMSSSIATGARHGGAAGSLPASPRSSPSGMRHSGWASPSPSGNGMPITSLANSSGRLSSRLPPRSRSQDCVARSSSTSLAFESIFGELAIKVVYRPPPESRSKGMVDSDGHGDGDARTDISLLRVNERKLDFDLVVHQIEAIHHFRRRGRGMELWYTDKDGDELRLTDTPGLIYACEDWRQQLSASEGATREKVVTRSMRIHVNETELSTSSPDSRNGEHVHSMM